MEKRQYRVNPLFLFWRQLHRQRAYLWRLGIDACEGTREGISGASVTSASQHTDIVSIQPRQASRQQGRRQVPTAEEDTRTVLYVPNVCRSKTQDARRYNTDIPVETYECVRTDTCHSTIRHLSASEQTAEREKQRAHIC
jgi:hypothetical protein